MIIQLGDRVRDRITGFEGIVTSITSWFNGCDRLGVQPETLHEGKVLDTECFDSLQLEIVKQAAISPVTVIAASAVTGGPRPSAKRAPDPTR